MKFKEGFKIGLPVKRPEWSDNGTGWPKGWCWWMSSENPVCGYYPKVSEILSAQDFIQYEIYDDFYVPEEVEYLIHIQQFKSKLENIINEQI